MKKIAIIHFMPLEYYPPITNTLDVLAQDKDLQLKVWSSHNTKGRQVYENKELKSIVRSEFPKPRESKIKRLLKYIGFNLKAFFGLLLYNPKLVFYYESYSAGPVYWYMKLFGKQKQLFIHHHEYFNQDWYDKGMALVKLYHTFEKKFLFRKAKWISQTNSYRKELFLKDHPYLNPSKLKVIANYPPKSWLKIQKKLNTKPDNNSSLKIIYVGSLSLEHTFIKEFCEWVIQQNGKVRFDIFAYNSSPSAKVYLQNLDSDFINFNSKGIVYDDIPKILVNYDIGVILYKATTLNAKHCASNKLFEYLVCGLEVWVSKEQEGTIPFLNYNERPTVKALNFKQLKPSLITDYYKSVNLPTKKTEFNCENELQMLIHALTTKI